MKKIENELELKEEGVLVLYTIKDNNYLLLDVDEKLKKKNVERIMLTFKNISIKTWINDVIIIYTNTINYEENLLNFIFEKPINVEKMNNYFIIYYNKTKVYYPIYKNEWEEF